MNAGDGALPESELHSLLDYLKRSRGFDFAGYKRPSLERRIQKRLDALSVGSYGDYEDYLEVNPDEFTELFNTILINVTGFFRDRAAWDYLATEVVPKLLEEKSDGGPIRVWSAACASGEEAYTIAMVLAEAMGEEEFRRRVKIYATDVDEDALTQARHAIYARNVAKTIPRELLERYWEPNGSGWGFRPDLRRSVIFGRNDLVQDAPISRVDLLVSRNALMYFTPETQSRILGHFNFSLTETGFLFLGKSEMLITHSDLFTPYNLKWRVFRKVPRAGMREPLAFVGAAMRLGDEPAERYAQLRDGAASVSPIPQVVLDRSGFVAFANQAAQTAFDLVAADIGRPFQDLELSYRPVELRTGIEESLKERRIVDVGRVEWRHSGSKHQLSVAITPLFGPGAAPMGVSVTFEDVTAIAELELEFKESKRQLETAYEELQSTVEELETTNEELQSTNEELETTNEELQSTNEELETMNEELHSTNDELEAMNDEQRNRTLEVDRLNLFLEGILGNLGLGVVVVDSDQRIQLWNRSASDLWGVRDDEAVGEDFLSLDIGLPVDQLRDPIRGALSDGDGRYELTLDAVNRRGQHFTCAVRLLPLVAPSGDHFGAIIMMSDTDGAQ